MKALGCTIYFDGACYLCSAEIEHYRRQVLRGGLDGKVCFVDIADPQFDAQSHGLDDREVNRVMHVRSADGQLHLGVEAFVEIWRNLPRYEFLSKAVEIPGIRPLLELGYVVFARVRPYLPRRKTCSTGACARV